MNSTPALLSESSDPTPNPDVEIAIIGAGLAGVGIAIALQRAGLTDLVLIDRATDFGGTWHTNTYPDVGADIPGLLYQFSFAKYPWSRVFPKGAEIKEYISTLVRTYRLRDKALLDTEVFSRTWDEQASLWRLDLGTRGQLSCRYMISADGMFIEPKLPDIPGLDRFSGQTIQSQKWPEAVDLIGKRVGVIGTGASGVQIIPRVAEIAGQLTVFQRRAAWVFPKPDLPIPRPIRWLLTRVPAVYSLVFTVVNWLVGNGFGWMAAKGIRLGKVVWLAHAAVEAYIRFQVADPTLRVKLLPTYPIICKRPTISNVYYSTFARTNVELVTQSIQRIEADGVITADGRRHPLDVLILATGFQMAASSNGRRDRPLRGEGGFDLAEFYEHHGEAAEYQGLVLPELPNAFIVCGRYSWAGPSHCSIVERAAIIIVRLITEAKVHDAEEIRVRREATQRFAEEMFDRQRESFAHLDGCWAAKTYFLDEHGVSSVYRPTSMSAAMAQARKLPMSDFEFRAVGTDRGLDRARG